MSISIPILYLREVQLHQFEALGNGESKEIWQETAMGRAAHSFRGSRSDEIDKCSLTLSVFVMFLS